MRSGVLEHRDPEFGAVLVDGTSTLAAAGHTSNDVPTPTPSCSPVPQRDPYDPVTRAFQRQAPRPEPKVEPVRGGVSWRAVPVYNATEAPNPVEGNRAVEWRAAIQVGPLPLQPVPT